MEEIIKIEEKDGRKAVNARELHQFLGNKREFATWIKQRIEQYGFVENQDYSSFDNIVKRDNGATVRKEYALSIDMAKELSMVENNEKGRIVRKYFIACEEKLKQGLLVIPNFSNPAEAERAWADQYEKNLALEAHNKELKEENQQLAPKGEYFDDLVARNLLTNFTKVAHQLNIKRKTFIDWLIRDKFIYRDQKNKLVPYAKYAHTYFHINDTKGKYSKWAGNQTLITPEGKEAFRLLYERRGEKLLDFKK